MGRAHFDLQSCARHHSPVNCNIVAHNEKVQKLGSFEMGSLPPRADFAGLGVWSSSYSSLKINQRTSLTIEGLVGICGAHAPAVDCPFHRSCKSTEII